ncbi:DNA polymerase beta superfamily protein [Peribacillus sp. SCS-155]|uniref:DNA polymerase beta superfamily protein n=1 Tax=Peribacillus sedimenti TaxID=3115297 RepID=UPI003906A9F2
MQEKYELSILMAAETGSHSFHLQSDRSDKDIRFIYKYNRLHSYLSINPPKELISYTDHLHEIEGWDLFKTARLFQKSNPALYEWFFSKQLFPENEFTAALKGVINDHYSLRTLGRHYFNMAARNIALLQKKDMNDPKSHKTLVQAGRCFLMCLFILQHRKLPPLSVRDLLAHVEIKGPISELLDMNFHYKRNHRIPDQTSLGGLLRLLQNI